MKYPGIYQCLLYMPWSEEVETGKCLYYGSATNACFNIDITGNCPYDGEPKIDIPRARAVVPEDELLDMLRGGR